VSDEGSEKGRDSGQDERRRFGRLSSRRSGAAQIAPETARNRISAYVYGNILVLAGVVGVDNHAIDDGAAVIAVLATTVTTYVAHVFAHNIGQRVHRTEDEHEAHVREEARDAEPILVSGVFPALILGATALDWLPIRVGQIIAAAVVVVRLAGTGITVERLSDRRVSGATVWSSLGIALVAAVIAVVKVLFGH
jgi:hypothetical protein